MRMHLFRNPAGLASLVMLLFLAGSTYSTNTNEDFEIQNISQTARLNMSYLYFGNPSTYVEQVNKTKNSLDIVYPNYFDITLEGSLQVTWKLQTSFIEEMHRRGIRVVPFLSNHWNLQAGVNGLAKREALAQSIAEAVQKYNLDGVNIDIEGVGHQYRDQFTDFVRIVRNKVPRNKEVSVAVASNPNGWKTGWHGFYDYAALSKISSYLMLMTYDESWQGSEPGPVASLPFVEKSVHYALKNGVPKEKIVIGIPFYGRIWKTNGPTLEGKVINGMGLSNSRVEPLLKKYNGITKYDEDKESPYAMFTIPAGQASYIGETKLTQGTYLLWFENERSIKRKLRLVSQHDLKGTGSWSLFQESPNTWDYYSLWLNGRYYRDVSPGHWAEYDIIFVSDKRWIIGTSSTTFSPTSTLTRAQGAAILIRALGLHQSKPREYQFTDLAPGHWARDAVEIAREHQIIHGIGKGKFAPSAPLTREQLAVILTRIFQYPVAATEENPFTDISPARGSYEAILTMYQRGIITGLKAGTFGPTKSSTRAQMAAIMTRLAEEFERKSVQ
jgi:spore germination protein YaaH